VACACTPADRCPDGTASEWYASPRDAALAVKRHVEAEDLYWLVHYVADAAAAVRTADAHVVSAVIHGIRYGPGGPDLATEER